MTVGSPGERVCMVTVAVRAACGCDVNALSQFLPH
jgi:hypothetical protein